MLLLLDGNNLAWAGYYGLERAMKPADDERKRRVAMLGLAGMLLGAIARGGEPPNTKKAADLSRVVIAFDEGRPLRRRQIYPAYQTGRERDPKFVANEPMILATIDEFSAVATKTLPVEVLQDTNTEADDLIAGVVERARGEAKRIVSSDRDFLQLIDAQTSVYSPVRKIVIDETNFFAGLGIDSKKASFPRERMVDYRALIGDSSDDLPGVTGIGPLTAAALLRAAPVESYYGKARAVREALGRRSEAVERAFHDGSAAEIVERNRALMDLRRAAPCWDRLPEITRRGAWDPEGFRAWFDEQRFSGVDGPALFRRFEALAGRPAA